MKYRAAFLLLLLILSGVLAAQTYPLAEVEVRLAHSTGGGCGGPGPCSRYEIAVRGDGSVEYKGVGLVEGTRSRTIPADEVIALVNEFLHARFFDALDKYWGDTSIVRKGDTVNFSFSGMMDDTQTDLTLRVGERKKTVTLLNNYPAELGKLPELVERIGGPQVWLRAGAAAPQSAKPTADFAFRFDFKPCANNTLDTYTNHYIREMGLGQPAISIPLTISAEQMATVYEAIVSIHFFDYPTDFKGGLPGPNGELTTTVPSATYRLEVRSASMIHAVSYDDKTTPRSDEANRLLNLFNLIIGFVNDHPDVKRLPIPRVGCM